MLSTMMNLRRHFRGMEFRRWTNPGVAAPRLHVACDSATRAVASTLHFGCKGKQVVLIVINEVTLVIEEEHPIISVL